MTSKNRAADDGTVEVVWAYEPTLKKIGKTERIGAAEAKELVRTGRARYAADEPADEKPAPAAKPAAKAADKPSD